MKLKFKFYNKIQVLITRKTNLKLYNVVQKTKRTIKD